VNGEPRDPSTRRSMRRPLDRIARTRKRVAARLIDGECVVALALCAVARPAQPGADLVIGAYSAGKAPMIPSKGLMRLPSPFWA